MEKLFITRATERLLFGRTQYNPESSFVKEIPDACLDKIEPVKPIRNMNRRIAQFAKYNHRKFVDFYTPLATKHGAMQPQLSKDGVHPNSACYNIMEQILLRVL